MADNTTNTIRKSRSPFPDCGGYEEYIPGLSEFEPARVQVFRIVNTELDPLDLNRNFYFFSEDCYIVRYTYPYHKRRNNLLYLWQGADSPLIRRRSARSLAKALDHRLHGRTTQVRVIQGHEPSHFRRLLRGNMVIYHGNPGAKLFQGPETFDINGVRMFHIRSSCLGDGQAIQVAALASSLNSEEAFILETPQTGYLWYGKHCSLLERQVTKTISLLLSPHKRIIVIEEGLEYPEFWSSIGGHLEYPHSYLHNRHITVPHRIYHCVLVQDTLQIDEIDSFNQHELLDDDVSIVDSGDNVYVWIGSGASELEKELAIERAQEILDRYYEGRSEEAVVVAVRRGYEPPSLVKLFPTWTENIWPTVHVNPDEELDDEIDLDTETISKIGIEDEVEFSPDTRSSSTPSTSSYELNKYTQPNTYVEFKSSTNENKYSNNNYSGIYVGNNRDIEELGSGKPDENSSEQEIEISDVDDGFGGFNFQRKTNQNEGSSENKDTSTGYGFFYNGDFNFKNKDKGSDESFSFENTNPDDFKFGRTDKSDESVSFESTNGNSKAYNFSSSSLHSFSNF